MDGTGISVVPPCMSVGVFATTRNTIRAANKKSTMAETAMIAPLVDAVIFRPTSSHPQSIVVTLPRNHTAMTTTARATPTHTMTVPPGHGAKHGPEVARQIAAKWARSEGSRFACPPPYLVRAKGRMRTPTLSGWAFADTEPQLLASDLSSKWL